MNSTGQENLPYSKRRKLNNASTIALPSYLKIAQDSIPIINPTLQTRKDALSDPEGLPVTIKSIQVTGNKANVVVTAPWLKVQATLVTHGVREQSLPMLNDCAALDSILKVYNNPARAVLACHHATLRLTPSPSLTVEILWQDSAIARDKAEPNLLIMLNRYLPPAESSPNDVDNLDLHQRHHSRIGLPRSAEPWAVQEFYENVYIPEANAMTNANLKIDLLHCDLYPFQRRAVRWLLLREGVEIGASGQVIAQVSKQRDSVMLGDFHHCEDADGNEIIVNNTLGVVSSNHHDVIARYNSIRGGLLGEAMGLGKTVEMIALIALHNKQNSPLVERPTHLRRSRATLIITPPSILEQWRQEIHAHAPSLRVYHYEGMRTTPPKKRSDAVLDVLCDQDVVLTTYSVIARELHYVTEKPDRALRNRPRAPLPKSPLDQILWWRVCLDEAQMIESGVSAAATVARLIPRVNAWAVTGTPIKQHHKDLFGLMLFLRYEPWCSSYQLWNHLVSFHQPTFRRLMNEIAIRHSKESVRDELRLPPQSRQTVTMSFTNIEQAHYSQLFYDMYTDCQLDQYGAPLDDEWDPEHPKTTEKMRTWLTRLRQTCVHPEVGGRNRKALGRNNGPLRTVQQVLDVMMDQAEGALRTEQRTMLFNKIRQGQLQENAKNTQTALRLYNEAYDEAATFVKECREALAMELVKISKGAKAKEESEADSDIEAEDDPQQLPARQRLRSALEVKHVCIFFMANIYFQLKSETDKVDAESDAFKALEQQETNAYEEAKKIRSELLVEVVRKANRRITDIKAQEGGRHLTELPDMELSEDDYGGIESRKIFEKFHHFCKAMNNQAEQFCELRSKMVNFLQQALIDEDEGVELQGDEYENSTKHQDEMYAYMEALRALFADRNDAITGQENLLIKSEMKQFLRSAKEGEGPAPELMIKLLADREVKRIKIDEQGSLRGIVAEIRALVSVLQFQEAGGSTRAAAELHVASKLLQHANKLLTAQTKSITALEQEVAHFRNSMNARLEYYKALQKVSDTVAPYREEDVGKQIDHKIYQSFVKAEEQSRDKCSSLQAKQRYLQHLKSDATSDSTPRICTICQSEFELGAITSCGHVFCKEDLQLWYAAHGNCPVCKRRLRAADFFDVTYKPSEMTVLAESALVSSPESPTSTSRPPMPSPSTLTDQPLPSSIYSDISAKQLSEIKDTEIRGASFGSKVDTICRHVHWLREKDPGSKAIIFSQFREVLDVLGRAFRQNQISFVKCDDKDGISDFKSNPATECLLLHAKAHSAGLNLVVASHVILCEPLINTAIELQAIARVHRIGQTRPTTVWMYLTADTVEESIYDLSVRRRLAHMQKRGQDNLSRSGTTTPNVFLHESVVDAANSRELQAADLSKALAPGRNGGEMVDKDDLWPCLFGAANKRTTVTGVLDQAADTAPASSEIGRFLRAEAADRRKA